MQRRHLLAQCTKLVAERVAEGQLVGSPIQVFVLHCPLSHSRTTFKQSLNNYFRTMLLSFLP